MAEPQGSDLRRTTTAMPEDPENRAQIAWLRRLERMGLAAELLPNGRAVVATLPLGPAPFETLGAPRRVASVRFSTVGADRIKCLAPRALFYLPLIRVGGCSKPGQIEARIRDAWNARLNTLRRTKLWLDRLGVEAEAPGDTPQWVFPVGLEDDRVRAAAVHPGETILPGHGPLSGVALGRAEDRVFRPDSGLASSVELELALGARLDELARLDERMREERRRRGASRSSTDTISSNTSELLEGRPLLLVGSGLATDRALQESLRLRGFRLRTARSIAEAVDAFASSSFELVLAELQLDRADGIELIPALDKVPGLEEVPVVLVDDRTRSARRELARRAGGRGYVARPLDGARLAPALARLVTTPTRRRFRRYRCRLAVGWRGAGTPGVTATIGRGGMFVRTEAEVPTGDSRLYSIHVPEMSATLRVESEVVYRGSGAEPSHSGVGLRFRSFSEKDERVLIAYLTDHAPARRSEEAGGRSKS